jgi:hypothetical protein
LAPLALVAAPNWGLQQEEIRALAEAWGRAIDKYFPDAMSHMGEIVVAGIVSISVIGPRVFQRVPLRLPKERVTGVAPDGRPIRANGAETEGEKSAPPGASTAPSGTADVATGISAVS